MRTGLIVLLMLFALVVVPASQPLELRVSQDGRRLITADGEPFFWLGDTAWQLFHRLTLEEADLYLKDRASKGFNVIQAVVLAELDGLGTPSAMGATPLVDNDPLKPNEAYFEHVDAIVDRAAALGMYVGMLPTWGDKWNRKWGVGPEVFTPENARSYGETLARRYRDKPVIWILGGDRSPESETHLTIIREMAAGIEAGSGGRQLMTYHPMGGNRSSTWFHADAWLDLNMFQSGHHGLDIANDAMTASDHALTPVKPVVDGEPRYEDHPINWEPKNGWFNDFDVRQAGYWSLLSGAAGHTYGDHNIWQMWEPGREPISAARTPWRVALNHPGSSQMGIMKRLFESRSFMDLVPDQTLLVRPDTGAAHQRAATMGSGSTAIVYTPFGSEIRLDGRKLGNRSLKAWWFDPRTGNSQPATIPARSEQMVFDPPGEPVRGNDWVLVVDDARLSLPKPGAARRP